MWTEIEKHLPQFESAVLNVRDEDGYPYSIRCHPEQWFNYVPIWKNEPELAVSHH